MTYEEAFFGTYKIDRHDGKPHLREGIFHPFDDIWKGILIFSGAVGCVVCALMLSMQLQFYRSVALHPEDYDPLTWKNYFLVIGFAVTFVPTFLSLAIPRWFFCKGTMHISFALSLLLLSIVQVSSHYILYEVSFTFSFETLGSVLWLLLTGAVLVVLYASAFCLISAGLTYLVNRLIAKRRLRRAEKARI